MGGVITVTAFLISAGITALLLHPSLRSSVLDYPNDRSLHRVPVPRTGGIAIGIALVTGISFAALSGFVSDAFVWIATGALLVALVSFLDDLYSLAIGYRLAVHLTAAGLVVAGSYVPAVVELPGMQWIPSREIAVGLAFAGMVWMTNLYNFMDGMDGFAAGMALFGFGTFAALGYDAGNLQFTLISLVIAASAGGFLIFNFPPARLFMGDTGSLTLGFLAAGCMLWGQRDGIFPLWVGILVFSPFIVDATVTLAGRMLKGERIWEAHKSHYYQRAVGLGLGHRRVVLIEYILMAGSSICAVNAANLPDSSNRLVIFTWCVVYAGLGIWITLAEKRKRQRHELFSPSA